MVTNCLVKSKYTTKRTHSGAQSAAERAGISAPVAVVDIRDVHSEKQSSNPFWTQITRQSGAWSTAVARARMDTNRLRWGGVTYRSLEEIRRGRCRHSEVKRPIIVGLQLHRQLQPFLVLCGSSIEQLAEIHQVDTSLPCDRKPQLRFGCRALHLSIDPSNVLL